MRRTTGLQKKVHDRLGWSDHGFKFDYWTATHHHVVTKQALADLTEEQLAEITLDPASTDLTDSEKDQLLGDHSLLVDPAWFRRWYRIADSVRHAAESHFNGKSPEELRVIRSMKFQSNKNLKPVVEALRRHHLIDLAVRRQLELPNIPKGLAGKSPGGFNYPRDKHRHLAAVVGAAMDPKLDLDQARVDAFLKPVRNPRKKADHELRSWMLEAYAGMMSSFLRHCISEWQQPPSAFIVEVAGEWIQGRVMEHRNLTQNDYIADVPKSDFRSWSKRYSDSALAKVVANSATVDDLHQALSQITSESTDTDLATVTYAVATGVPVQWVTSDIVAGVMDHGDTDAIDWSNTGFRTETLNDLLKRIYPNV